MTKWLARQEAVDHFTVYLNWYREDVLNVGRSLETEREGLEGALIVWKERSDLIARHPNSSGVYLKLIFISISQYSYRS